jgi:hypothetical protein
LNFKNKNLKQKYRLLSLIEMSQIHPYRGKQKRNNPPPPGVPVVSQVQRVSSYNPQTRQHELTYHLVPHPPKAAPKKLPPPRSRSRSPSPSPSFSPPRSPSRSPSPPRPKAVKSGPKNPSIAQFEVVIPQIPKAPSKAKAIKQGNAARQRLQEAVQRRAGLSRALRDPPPPPTKIIKALPVSEKRAVYQQETQYKKKDGSDGKKVRGAKFVLGKTKNGGIIKKTVPDANIESTPERPLYVKARPQDIEVPMARVHVQLGRPSPSSSSSSLPLRPSGPKVKFVPRRSVKQ